MKKPAGSFDKGRWFKIIHSQYPESMIFIMIPNPLKQLPIKTYTLSETPLTSICFIDLNGYKFPLFVDQLFGDGLRGMIRYPFRSCNTQPHHQEFWNPKSLQWSGRRQLCGQMPFGQDGSEVPAR